MSLDWFSFALPVEASEPFHYVLDQSGSPNKQLTPPYAQGMELN